jgi:hypothetical protein
MKGSSKKKTGKDLNRKIEKIEIIEMLDYIFPLAANEKIFNSVRVQKSQEVSEVWM